MAAKLNARVEDMDFNPEDFIARINSDLIGKYVNIASRAANFITRHFDSQLGYLGDTRALEQAFTQQAESVRQALETREYNRAIREIMGYADSINQAFDAAQPWVLAKGFAEADEARRAQLQDICSRALAGFKASCWRRCCRPWQPAWPMSSSACNATSCGAMQPNCRPAWPPSST